MEYVLKLKGFTEIVLGNLKRNLTVQSKLKIFLIFRKGILMEWWNQRRNKIWETRPKPLSCGCLSRYDPVRPRLMVECLYIGNGTIRTYGLIGGHGALLEDTCRCGGGL